MTRCHSAVWAVGQTHSVVSRRRGLADPTPPCLDCALVCVRCMVLVVGLYSSPFKWSARCPLTACMYDSHRCISSITRERAVPYCT